MQIYKTPRKCHGRKLDDLGDGNDFLDITPKGQFMKEITDKLDLIKVKNVCSVKERSRG